MVVEIVTNDSHLDKLELGMKVITIELQGLKNIQIDKHICSLQMILKI